MQQLGFYNSNFVYFPLPNRKPSGNSFTKKLSIGDLSFSSSESVPYGLYARLAIISLTNIACRNKNQNKVDTFTLFGLLKELKGTKPTGIQLNKFSQQMQNWAATLITLKFDNDERKAFKNLLLIESAMFQKENELNSSERVFVNFTDAGKEFLISSAFPIPNAAVQSITQAFDFDILTWLISSIYQIRYRADHKTIEWDSLAQQFGISSDHMTRFKAQFCKTLYNLKCAYYPDAKIYRTDEGIIIGNSPLLTEEKNSLKMPNFQEV